MQRKPRNNEVGRGHFFECVRCGATAAERVVSLRRCRASTMFLVLLLQCCDAFFPLRHWLRDRRSIPQQSRAIMRLAEVTSSTVYGAVTLLPKELGLYTDVVPAQCFLSCFCNVAMHSSLLGVGCGIDRPSTLRPLDGPAHTGGAAAFEG